MGQLHYRWNDHTIAKEKYPLGASIFDDDGINNDRVDAKECNLDD
jgi:hypothetical protein